MALPTPHDDARAPEPSALVARAAQGDQEAWNALAAMYASRLYALARSRLRDGHLAEDVAQSVFVTLAKKLRSPEGAGYTERGRFESWLFRIAMNRVRDVARKQQRRPEVFSGETVDVGAPPDHDDDAGEDLAALRTAMAELPDRDREVIELRHHAGLSFKQIADVTGEPLGTLLARHHRTLRKLRDLIESQSQSPPAPVTDEAHP